jgi:4'-phosphopantetheinyl transferase
MQDPMILMQKMWQDPPRQNRLVNNQVFVWRVHLGSALAPIERLRSFLSPEEAARVARLHFELDRRRATVSRGLLRVLLGRELSEQPERIAFSWGAQGKPELARGDPTGLQFNLSHSHKELLIAMARGRRLGVDVEYMRGNIGEDEISLANFTAAECSRLRALPATQRSIAFFSYWTCKEAFIKANGGGLSIPLDAFEVAIELDRDDVPVRVLSPQIEGEECSIRRLAAPEGYAAALAAAGSHWELRCWNWDFAREII